MTTEVEFLSGDQAAPPDPRSIPCLCMPCAGASVVVGTSYTLDPGDDVVSVLGPGKVAAWVLAIHAGAGSRVEVCAATATWTSLSGTLTQSGSGPAVTIGNASGFSGALDDYPNFRIRIKVAGVLGVAMAEVSYDGTNYVDEFVIPAEGPAVVRGTVNIASSVPAMNTLTIITTAPTSDTMTFVTSPTTPDTLVSTYDGLADGEGSTTHGRIFEAATGEKYFEIVTDEVGTGVSLTISATSTGEGTLGLSTTTATGTASTVTLPNTGIKLTFASGTYVLNEVYNKALTGPTASLSAQIAAATAAGVNFADHPFGYLVFSEQATHTAAATLAGSIGTLVAGWAADPDASKFVDFVVGTAFHTASATRSTNNTNIGTSDGEFVSAVSGQSAYLARNYALDDCYLPGPAGLPSGTFRRSAALAGAIRRSSLDRIAGNPGWHEIPLVSLLAADGATWARDEATATTKLGKLTGKAWCLKAMKAGPGHVKFSPAATGAGSLSRYRDPGVVAIAYSIAAAMVAFVEAWEGEQDETDPESPSALSPEALADRANALAAYLRPIVRPPNKPPNISGEPSVVCTGATTLDDGEVQTVVKFNPLAVIQNVAITIIATGQAITIEGAEG